jgi:biopolymer transport protein ExbB
MTGIGLAVAIPAVIGYNTISRANRVLAAKLDAFAFELMSFLTLGQTLRSSAQTAAPVTPLRVAPAQTASAHA